jgi:hypothetical protein
LVLVPDLPHGNLDVAARNTSCSEYAEESAVGRPAEGMNNANAA